MACSKGTLRRCQGPESCVLGIERRRRPTLACASEPGGLALQAALAGNGALVGEAGIGSGGLRSDAAVTTASCWQHHAMAQAGAGRKAWSKKTIRMCPLRLSQRVGLVCAASPRSLFASLVPTCIRFAN